VDAVNGLNNQQQVLFDHVGVAVVRCSNTLASDSRILQKLSFLGNAGAMEVIAMTVMQTLWEDGLIVLKRKEDPSGA